MPRLGRLVIALFSALGIVAGLPAAVGASVLDAERTYAYDSPAHVVTPAHETAFAATTPAPSTRLAARAASSAATTSLGVVHRFAGRDSATRGADDVAPKRIYSARELRRRAAEPGPFHNFPGSFNDKIFERGARTVTPGFSNQSRRGLSNDAAQYRLRGAINGRSGTYEIFARPSRSGRTEVIQHRFFKPDPR